MISLLKLKIVVASCQINHIQNETFQQTLYRFWVNLRESLRVEHKPFTRRVLRVV